MATISGMDYSKMQALIQDLTTQKDLMVGILSDLITSVPARLELAYSGDAATQYKDALQKVIENIDATLKEIITQLNANAEQKQTDYATQDKKMQESITVPTAE